MSADGIHEGVSDDGLTYVRLIKDDDKANVINNDNDDASHNDDDVIGKIDVSVFPEEQRPIVTKLLDGYKAMSSENSTLKQKADFAEVLEKTVATLGQNKSGDGQPQRQIAEVKKLADTLQEKFGKDDYYAPFFIEIAKAIDNIGEKVTGFDGKISQTQQQTFEEKVTNFVKANKIPIAVVKQMDVIAARMGRDAYNDLDNLMKYAKIDLGIKDDPAPKKDEVATQKKINNAVNMSGVRRQQSSSTGTKEVKTMADAMDKAMEDLAEEAD